MSKDWMALNYSSGANADRRQLSPKSKGKLKSVKDSQNPQDKYVWNIADVQKSVEFRCWREILHQLTFFLFNGCWHNRPTEPDQR